MEVNVYPYIHAYAESYAFVCSWLFACMADERRQVFGILIGRWHLTGYNSTSLTSTQLVASDIMNSMATIYTVQTALLKHWGEGIESNCAERNTEIRQERILPLVFHHRQCPLEAGQLAMYLRGGGALVMKPLDIGSVNTIS